MGLSQILESAFCYLQQSLFYYSFNMYIRSDRLLKGGENVKFIHTGDIHWGMSPDSDKPWSRERSRDIRDTFTAIIAKAKELRVDSHIHRHSCRSSTTRHLHHPGALCSCEGCDGSA